MKTSYELVVEHDNSIHYRQADNFIFLYSLWTVYLLSKPHT